MSAASMAAFGHEEPEAHRIVIVGGGNIGLFLAKELESNHSQLNIKMIEISKERAERAAQELSRTIVVNGDALDLEILDEVNIQATESIVTVSNDDEVNILSSLLAKRSGCRGAMTWSTTRPTSS